MFAHDAARIFHDWANKEGLLSDTVAPVISVATDFLHISPISDAGKAILRSKQILSICYSESKKEIVVMLKRAAPKTKPQLAKLPGLISDVKIIYRQGESNINGLLPAQPFGSPPYRLRSNPTGDKYTCGSSISVGNFQGAGTLGCLVRDVSGRLFGLSNNHVSASCSHADVGLPILAPGIFDVSAMGLPPFTIGFHERSLPMIPGSVSNVDPLLNSDAAIFSIRDPNLVTSYQGIFYDTPGQAIDLVDGIVVEKVGRTTGYTKGRVLGPQYGSVPVAYSVPHHNFTGFVSFAHVHAVVGEGSIFSDSGDSGSLVTTVDPSGNRFAVGLVFAGRNDSAAPGEKTSLILPIKPILEALGVTLVTGHNANDGH